MSSSLNTALALMKAKNYEGARRLVNEHLEKYPQDVLYELVRIKIELKAENFDVALSIIQVFLSHHPHIQQAREFEFEALMHLKKYLEASDAYETFKRDFPQERDTIKEMELVLEMQKGKASSARKIFEDLTSTLSSPIDKKRAGINYQNLGSLFHAHRLMIEAHSDLPDDEELNIALAANSFALARPATCRKYARLALATSHQRAYLKFLLFASYLLYLPPYLMMAGIFLIIRVTSAYMNKYISLAITFIIFFVTNDFFYFWSNLLARVINIKIIDYDIFLLVTTIIVIYAAAAPALFSRKKAVKLKGY